MSNSPCCSSGRVEEASSAAPQRATAMAPIPHLGSSGPSALGQAEQALTRPADASSAAPLPTTAVAPIRHLGSSAPGEAEQAPTRPTDASSAVQLPKTAMTPIPHLGSSALEQAEQARTRPAEAPSAAPLWTTAMAPTPPLDSSALGQAEQAPTRPAEASSAATLPTTAMAPIPHLASSALEQAEQARTRPAPEKKPPAQWRAPVVVASCRSCGKSCAANRLLVHPLLKTSMCKSCFASYQRGVWELDADGREAHCRWCGEGIGARLLLCDTCPHGFCERCVVRNFGRAFVTRLLSTDDEWKCFTCHPSSLRSMIQLNSANSSSENTWMRSEKLLLQDVSNGHEEVGISVVNGEDDEGPPVDFTYITQPFSQTIDTVCLRNPNFFVCCNCTDNCRNPATCPCARASGGVLAYNREGRLTDRSLAIYECNMFCRCHRKRCRNRVVGDGVRHRLQVFRTKNRGWGVRCLDDISAGTFVTDYLGEILTEKGAEERGLVCDEYLFDLDMWASDCARSIMKAHGMKELLEEADEAQKHGRLPSEQVGNAIRMYDTQIVHLEKKYGLVVDAKRFGNVARFLNHACDPNLTRQIVFSETQDARMPRLAFFAAIDIPAMTELTWDYGYRPGAVQGKTMICKCGGSSCRGKLY